MIGITVVIIGAVDTSGVLTSSSEYRIPYACVMLVFEYDRSSEEMLIRVTSPYEPTVRKCIMTIPHNYCFVVARLIISPTFADQMYF